MRDIETLKDAAQILVEGTDNVEYVRGICELIADVDGIPDVGHADRSIQIARDLGVSEDVIDKMY